MKPILEAGRNCWAIEPVAESGLLIDGCEYFEAFHAAACAAEQYILLTGWQFDSNTPLICGDHVPAEKQVRFLDFLNQLVVARPPLRIYILAWDFSPIYTFKREFLQELMFNWKTPAQIRFKFDANHPVGASHHQKFAVIDGDIGFPGGLDICRGRWDTRCHVPKNPLRMDPAKVPYGMHHDLQGYVRGRAAARLTEMFNVRWKIATNEDLDLPPPRPLKVKIRPTVRIRARQVALARTYPRLLAPAREPIGEIRALFCDAVAAAERLIYIENQYFSSDTLYRALVQRLEDPARSKLQLVLVLPREFPHWLETLSIGVAQTKLLRALRRVALKHGHEIGIFCTTRLDAEGGEHQVFIHGKLIIIDDRFMMTGSANTSNRSMGLDTELNVAWDASSQRHWRLMRSIRKTRGELLSEHTGVRYWQQRQRLTRIRNLTRYLKKLAANPRYSLQPHPLVTLFDQHDFLKKFEPDDFTIDPERPFIEDNVYEAMSKDPNSLFVRGVAAIAEWLQKG